MKKSSSKKWLQEHFSDSYVKRARKEGFRARSVYKLMEIDKRYKLIRPNMVVVDLGASPGGWSEYVVGRIGSKGRVVALDILPIKSIKGVEFIQGDFTKNEVVEDLSRHLGDQRVDLVLSDMAPNLSGIKDLDQMRSLALAEQAFDFAMKVLKPEGTFLIKMFQGTEFDSFLKMLRQNFKEVKVVKPEASRSRSSEIFLLARKI